MNSLKKLIKSALSHFGYEIIGTERLEQAFKAERDFADLNATLDSSEEFQKLFPAQLRQDLFVLVETGFKRGGVFIDVGAADGIWSSNTYYLESRMGWEGVLVEPAAAWHDSLTKNRTSPVDTRCAWSKTGEQVIFNMPPSPSLSTIDQFSDADHWGSHRTGGEKPSLDTVSLVELIKEYKLPSKVDYLSIDTEGSEYEILAAFDFDNYDIGIITCEHNYTENREKIFHLLTSKGYERKWESFSKWDDWYVREPGRT